jgi:hypothetical protein
MPVIEAVEVDALEDGVLHRTLRTAEVNRLYLAPRTIAITQAATPLVEDDRDLNMLKFCRSMMR